MNKIDLNDSHLVLDRRRLLLGAGAGALAGSLPILMPRKAGAALRLEITQGNPQPMPIALPDFVSGAPAEAQVAHNVTAIISNNLQRSGLFAPINPAAFTEKIVNSDAVPRFPDWRVINAQALVTGRITRQGDGRLKAEFRLWDVFAGQHGPARPSEMILFIMHCDNFRSLSEHVAGLETDLDVFPHVVMLRPQHRIRLALQNGAAAAVGESRSERRSRPFDRIGPALDRAVAAEHHAEHDLEIASVFSADRNSPARGDALA